MDPIFRFRHSVDVRFRDIDLAGHAHHAQALVYFEEARSAYWREVVGRDGALDIDYIMAEASIRWHKRVLWPQVLSVGVRVSRLGRKHFEMQYEVCDAEGERLQSGSSIQVMYDYAAAATKRLPAEVRTAIESFDGPFSDAGGIGSTRRNAG